MPLFTSASGFQINGGNFIDNAGDINIHTVQLMPGPNLNELEFDTTEGPSRQLLAPERNDHGAARMRPYGMLPALCKEQAVPDKAEKMFLVAHRF
jgi:hypothetical protein